MTLKGFKSFASTTHLNFETGITCVVGPNGSGKSNVIDGLAWVMGEQGAKTLRGGKMEDVIFSGTSGRAPLGRAEVEVTIDNTDGSLPIDYSEVTISRILFRNGQSEYQINGQSSRLLDVQELLSDSGIGREMHVIVGQGKLSEILLATPEDRRSFIEEAAGVLKHRKRKEKALRKLDSMQLNFSRIQDLTVELRRQLKPLGKQSEVARKASMIQSDVRDAKLRLLADDILNARKLIDEDLADESSLRFHKDQVEKELTAIRAREEELDQISLRDNPKTAQMQDIYYRLTGLREKFRALQTLASDRVKYLAQELEDARASGRDPESLEAEANALEVTKNTLNQELQHAIAEREKFSLELTSLENQLHLEENRVATALHSMADQRESLARHEGHLKSLRSAIEATNAEITRLENARQDAQDRINQYRQEAAALEIQIASAVSVEPSLDANFENTKSELKEAAGAVEKLNLDLSRLNEQKAGLQGKLDALTQSFQIKNGNEKITAHNQDLSIVGKISDFLEIESGFEKAVARALGDLADALLATNLSGAISAVNLLKDQKGGNSEILIISDSNSQNSRLALNLNRLSEKVKAPKYPNLVESLLNNIYWANNLESAAQFIKQDPNSIVVTTEGDLVSNSRVSGGSGSHNSLIEINSLISNYQNQLSEIETNTQKIQFELATAKNNLANLQSEYEKTLSALNESDAALSALASNISTANQNAKNAQGEFERLGISLDAAKNQRDIDLETLSKVDQEFIAPPAQTEPDTSLRDDLAKEVNGKRNLQVEAHLAVRSLEERLKTLEQNIVNLRQTAIAERENAANLVERRKLRSQAVVTAGEIAQVAGLALTKIEASVNEAAANRESLERSKVEREGEILSIRARARELAVELEKLTSSVHQDEMARTEQRLRIEAMELKAIEELGVDVQTLINEYGPQIDVPTTIENESGEFVPGEVIPYRREQQEKRLARAEKDLAMLGKINPLALEEFTSLQERLKFLAEELEDLKKAKADLLNIVKEVDEKVETIFKDAYFDVEREFSSIFSRLFPGGDGRLKLTAPDDWTTTGIEIEARPPGKRFMRLSLLSGGEQSLSAVAFLVAIFKARPSPFYVMDEVEAALDDTNLGRLLEIFEELRENSQLIIITHQKRTMEIADALYGVTMKKDGISEVISQRLREATSA